MLTRGPVTWQYGHPGPGDYSPPPWHATMHPHQYTPHHPSQGRPPMGLEGGAVILTGVRGGPDRGPGGLLYLGMDPSDPATWPRPFNPAPGMIGYLNGACR
jgi:hypothetical protein